MKKEPRAIGQEIIARLTEFAGALRDEDKISDKFTCRQVVLDLAPAQYNKELVLQTRELLNASQVIFAKLLGVSPKTVRAWEQGANVPNDIACRFMDEIRYNPDYWRNRLVQSLVQRGPKQLQGAK